MALLLPTVASAEVQAKTVLSRFVTTGADIAGAKVTARFLDGQTETLAWQATGKASGGVAGTGWRLGQSLDSFRFPWLLTVDAETTLSRLTINLLEGNGLFDISPSASGPLNTPGSRVGAAFRIQPGAFTSAEPSRVRYDWPVDISQGDLFTALTLEWDSGLGGQALEFVADTDSGTVVNPVRLANAPVFAEAIATPLVPPDQVKPQTAVAIPLAPPDRVKPRPAVEIPLAPPDAVQWQASPKTAQPQSVPESGTLIGLLGVLSLGAAKAVGKGQQG